MSNFIIALLFALGAGTWIYSKLMKSTGGNVRNSLTVAGVAAAFLLVILLVVLGQVFDN